MFLKTFFGNRWGKGLFFDEFVSVWFVWFPYFCCLTSPSSALVPVMLHRTHSNPAASDNIYFPSLTCTLAGGRLVWSGWAWIPAMGGFQVCLSFSWTGWLSRMWLMVTAQVEAGGPGLASTFQASACIMAKASHLAEQKVTGEEVYFTRERAAARV